MADRAEAELLHLVDRAERGCLLAGEALQLRDGVRKLAAARRSLGGKQSETRRLRERHDELAQRLSVTAEQLQRTDRAYWLAVAEIIRLYRELAAAKLAGAQPARTA